MQRVYGRSRWTWLRLFTVVILAVGLLAPARSGANSLRLDGRLIVKGMSMEGARVIVVSHDKAPEVLSANLSNFTLTLELEKEYLLSFERPGCMSKQLQFNTKVPEGADIKTYNFPFQVTLEAALPGGEMEYAGPVGYIKYDGRLNDFGYSTDYRIQKDAVLNARLEKARGEINAGSVREAGKPAVAAAAEKPVAPAAKPMAMERTAPSVRHVPPMVHVLEKPGSGNAVPREAVVLPTPVAEPSVVKEDPLDHGWPMFGLASEVLVDPLHVTTIVTRMEGGRKIEYRRVASYYGGVTYFCNGRPCSAEVYYKGIEP